MEEQKQNQVIETKIEKKSFMKKKFLGMPVFMLMIFGVAMVAATVTVTYVIYTHGFTKTINVFGIDGGSNEYVTIIGSGDIGSSVINCDASSNNSCIVTSGDITLLNSDSLDHNCTIQTWYSQYVTVSYSSSITPYEVYQYVSGGGIVTVPANNGNITFNIIYQSNTPGRYPIKTDINCP